MPDFDMSPYGAFIWPCWILSAVVLGALVVRAAVLARRWDRADREASRTRGDDAA